MWSIGHQQSLKWAFRSHHPDADDPEAHQDEDQFLNLLKFIMNI